MFCVYLHIDVLGRVAHVEKHLVGTGWLYIYIYIYIHTYVYNSSYY